MKKDIVLSKRMEAVVNMISPQSLVVDDAKEKIRIADVGCDHAYVSIALLERNLADRVIAMDVRKGPLQIAAKNVEMYGLSDRITLRLSDGLEKVEPDEVDAVIIAGMGGLLVKRIVQQGIPRIGRPVLVLQPQSDIHEVRALLGRLSYVIDRETNLVDEGKDYTVIRAVPRELCKPDIRARYDETPYLPVELRYGRYGLLEKDRQLQYFLQKQQGVLQSILQTLEERINAAQKEQKDVPEKTRERLDAVKKELMLNCEALSYFTK